MTTNANVRVGVWGLVFKDDEVLLVKKHGRAFYERPGGKIEENELAADAFVRETYEETGVKIKNVRFSGIHEIMEDYGHWIAIGFFADHDEGEAVAVEPDKHAEVGWFSLDNLPEVSKWTGLSIEEYKVSKPWKT